MSNSVRPHRQQPTRLPHTWDSPGKNTGVGWHFLLQCMKVKSEREVAQSCPTLRNPMGCSLPGSSAHEIFQARVLEWGAIAFSKTKSYQIPNLLTLSLHYGYMAHLTLSLYLLEAKPWCKWEVTVGIFVCLFFIMDCFEYVHLSLTSLGCFIHYQSEELYLLNVPYMFKVKESTRKEKCPVSISQWNYKIQESWETSDESTQ